MMVLDVNLLLYAYHSASREHRQASAWLEQALSGPDLIGLSWTTILGFLRIATTPRILSTPYEVDAAVEIVATWLSRPNTRIVHPTEQHWPILRSLLPKSRVRGSLILDAHLAALAIEHGATLCTNDRDFARFPGLRVAYPLQ